MAAAAAAEQTNADDRQLNLSLDLIAVSFAHVADVSLNLRRVCLVLVFAFAMSRGFGCHPAVLTQGYCTDDYLFPIFATATKITNKIHVHEIKRKNIILSRNKMGKIDGKIGERLTVLAIINISNLFGTERDRYIDVQV
jgi:hypothetical protein